MNDLFDPDEFVPDTESLPDVGESMATSQTKKVSTRVIIGIAQLSQGLAILLIAITLLAMVTGVVGCLMLAWMLR